MLFGRRKLLHFCIVYSSVVRRSAVSLFSHPAQQLDWIRAVCSTAPWLWGAFCPRSTSVRPRSTSLRSSVPRLRCSARRKLLSPAPALPWSPRYRPPFRLRSASCQSVGFYNGNFLRSLSSGCFLCVICTVFDFLRISNGLVSEFIYICLNLKFWSHEN